MTTPDPQDPQPVEIRRYSNRRFYDTSSSRHITLEGIRGMIRDGRDVRIVEASSGEDITSRILTQIILEYDSPKISVMPPVMLHRLIRSSEPLLLEFMEQYVANGMRVFEESQQSMRDQWSRFAGMAGVPSELARWWQNPLAGGMPGWPPQSPQSPQPPQPPQPPQEAAGEAAGRDEAAADEEPALRREVEELRRQLDAMRREIGGKGPGPEAG